MLHYVKVTYCAVERNRTAQSGLESQILITIHGLSLADFHKQANLHNPIYDFLLSKLILILFVAGRYWKHNRRSDYDYHSDAPDHCANLIHHTIAVGCKKHQQSADYRKRRADEIYNL